MAKKKAARRATPPKRKWDLGFPAHTSTWSYLGENEGLDSPFPQAGAMKLSTLNFWISVGAGSSKSKAKGLALRLDEYFADWMYVPYEEGMDFALAISALYDVLIDAKTNTVEKLAQKVDEIYKFRGDNG